MVGIRPVVRHQDHLPFLGVHAENLANSRFSRVIWVHEVYVVTIPIRLSFVCNVIDRIDVLNWYTSFGFALLLSTGSEISRSKVVNCSSHRGGLRRYRRCEMMIHSLKQDVSVRR